jgi:hypothetical protein
MASESQQTALVPLRRVLRRRLFDVCCCSIALTISGSALAGHAIHEAAWHTWIQPPMAINTALCVALLALDRLVDVLRKIKRRAL